MKVKTEDRNEKHMGVRVRMLSSLEHPFQGECEKRNAALTLKLFFALVVNASICVWRIWRSGPHE